MMGAAERERLQSAAMAATVAERAAESGSIPGPTILSDETERTIRFDLPDQEPIWCESQDCLVVPIRGMACVTTPGYEDTPDVPMIDVTVLAVEATKAGKPRRNRRPYRLRNDKYRDRIRRELGL